MLSSNDKGYIYELIPYSGKIFSYDKYFRLGGSIIKNLTKKIKLKIMSYVLIIFILIYLHLTIYHAIILDLFVLFKKIE